jgi:DNA-binding NarL/FixJ family response regulator
VAADTAGTAGAEGRDSPEVWVFIRSESVPDRWRHRAVSVTLLPLLPDEAAQFFGQGNASPQLDPTDEAVARLAARGETVTTMARHLNVSTRSIDRHLARLRERFGVASTTELAVELAKRGF